MNVIKNMALLGMVSASAACGPAPVKPGSTIPLTATEKVVATRTEGDNLLSATEREAGTMLLFDGESTAGWRAYQDKPSESWLATDGMLHCLGDSANNSDLRADLVTT
ncbi:MAG: DUF1080 domain-containing protein, partial [Saprospiraceae bacterium]|nr:DUF1080 domain-containing protein [Saprospiraceae bacterium]